MNQGIAQASSVIPMTMTLVTKVEMIQTELCRRSLFQTRFIALLRSFLGVSRRHTGPKLIRSNRGYPCSRRSLSEGMDKMTVPSWREPKIAASMDELSWSEPYQTATAPGFVAFVLPMFPPIAPSLGTPFFNIITIPICIYRHWDGDDVVCVRVLELDEQGPGQPGSLPSAVPEASGLTYGDAPGVAVRGYSSSERPPRP